MMFLVMQYWCKAVIFCNRGDKHVLHVTSWDSSCWYLKFFSSREGWHTDKNAGMGLFLTPFDKKTWCSWRGVVDSLQLASAAERNCSNTCRQATWWNKNLLQREEDFWLRKELIMKGARSSGIFSVLLCDSKSSMLLFNMPTVRDRDSKEIPGTYKILILYLMIILASLV